ncbi:MAG: serine/threonine protein kinase, partial [Nannocystaceae bacterium]|nr:serine/threonine protein kinase [Nannocystaceae bacterium]
MEAPPEPQPSGDRLDRVLADLGRAGTPRDAWDKHSIAASLFGDPEPERRIGRFKVIERIGRGGMGEVWAALDEQLGRKVAIKLMQGQARPEDLLRFTREGRTLARLSHPNIVPIHEIGEDGGAMYIAMELLEGQTLAQWLTVPARTWQQRIGVLLEAGRGLQAAHEAGIVHRDFKPENVMVGSDGRVRVLDFGLARGLEHELALARTPISEAGVRSDGDGDEVTRTGALLGTPAYMAPEQHAGERATAASDQFSFCVVAFEALYGVRPFAGRDRAAIVEAMASGRVAEPARRNVPRAVHRAIVRGLAIDPGARWPSMAPLLAALAHGIAPRRWPALALATAAIAGAVVLARSPESTPPPAP